jgi:nucleoside-diphosphate-sugar epimerase
VTTVAVTGASGFVGGAVCRAAAAAGLRVLAYGRRPAVDPAHVAGAPYRAWDITAGPLDGAEPVDAVVHCAAAVIDWGRAAEVRLTNVAGTANVLASFPAPARFVHVSSASVYDPRRPTVRATEDQAPRGRSIARRYLNDYGRTKAAAEALVAGAVATGREAVVLRPRAVYGPGDPTLLPRLLAAAGRGTLRVPGDGRQLASLTSVANLAAACLLAATGPVRAGVFNVTDAEPVVLVQALRALLAECGLPARVRPVPAGPVRALAAAAELAWRAAGRPGPPPLTRYAVANLAVERTLDIGAARAALGYRPAPTSFAGAGRWTTAVGASLPG